ncbi:hypothetical protein F2Q68_00016249 [Brassica cretica]|uniref:Uncharacterized protein n=1 Tax=Brassica cretica TaxID=69181 RepID=A0A8S9HUR5_BRACR|nr:hypothetical protein F2Q68_00016249 [Brassica cretica]
MAINQLHFSDFKDGCCKKTVVAQLLRFLGASNLKKVGEHLGLDLVFLDKKLMALANTNVDFPDIFGDVCGIKTTLTMRIRPFNVLLCRCCHDKPKRPSVCVSVFGMIVYQLHQKLEVSGRLLLNATPGTTSFDNECLAGQSVLAALYGSDDGSSSTASKYGSVKKIERVTLAELNNYVLNSPTQTAKFLCTAEVGDIDTTNGWCYFSYSKCYQKLQRGFTSFTCAWCMTTLQFVLLYGSDDGSSSTASKYGSVKKIERVTLAELNNYVLNSPTQTAKFLCTAEVGDIDTTNGWCYFSYSKCYQKLQRGFTSFTCAWCMTTLQFVL